MAVMRQYVSLSGSMGVDNLATHFQHEFLTAWKRNFEGGGAQFGKRRCGHSPQCGLDEAKLSERISSAHRGLVPADCVTQCGYEQLAGLAAHRPDLSR